jgi:calcium-translocating P-type ATPase
MVIRNGIVQQIPCNDVVAGDVVSLSAGDKVPADGVLVDGSDVSANEAAMTGEPDDLQKHPYGSDDGDDCFCNSGSIITSGFGKMVVTAVGVNSKWGKICVSLSTDPVETPLQEKLNVLANQIGNGGMLCAGGTFIGMLGLWTVAYNNGTNGETNLFEAVLQAFIMAVAIVVVAVPEGLPLAVTLSLAFSTSKMMEDNNLIRVLSACETMGNATTICSDKTGTLTQNRMSVVRGWFAGKELDVPPNKKQISTEALDILADGISINSTASLLMPDEKDSKNGLAPEVLGNKTEGALLLWLHSLGIDFVKLRAEGFDATMGDQMFTFSSDRKRMSVLQMPEAGLINGKAVLFTKGASEVVLDICTHQLDHKGEHQTLTAGKRKRLEELISEMAAQSLRTLAICHRDVSKADLKAASFRGGGYDALELEKGMILDAIVGIKDPLRTDVVGAVEQCQAAGIVVRMVTGDNINTATAIARECSILTPGGLAMEGPEFRRLTPAQLDEILPRLQVLARSSPQDKLLLVSRLNGNNLPEDKDAWEAWHAGQNCTKKTLADTLPGMRAEWELARSGRGGVGDVVGVTGDGTNDGPALKAADVGLSMGLSGTEGTYDLGSYTVRLYHSVTWSL